MIERETIHELWSRHLAGDCLSSSEQQALLDALDEREFAASLLRDEQIDGMLRAMAESAEDGESFTKAFIDRLKAERDAEKFVADLEARVRAETVPLQPKARPAARLIRPSHAFAAAAAVVLLAAGVALALRSGTAGQASSGTDAEAEVGRVLARVTSAKAVAIPAHTVRANEAINVPAGGHAALRFDDGTVLAIGPESNVKLSDASGAKIVSLGHGSIAATVTKQPVGRPLTLETPNAQITVLGTELIVCSSPDQTRLEVIEGRVALKRIADGKSVQVAAGQYALLEATGELSVCALPSNAEAEQGYVYRDGNPGIYDIEFSPDGKLLAMASGERAGRVLLWDVAAGRYRAPLEGHTQGVGALAFSRDGRRMASGSADRTILVWDTATWSVSATLQTDGDGVNALAFSPDGLSLAAACKHNAIQIWDLSSGARRKLQGHSGEARSVAFTPDGKTLISGSEDKTAKIWDLENGQVRQSLPHGGWVRAVAVAPRGDVFATGDSTGRVQRFDLATGEKLASRKAHATFIRDLTYSTDGSRLAASSEDNSGSVLDPLTLQQEWRFAEHRADVSSVALTSDGKILATGSHDNTVSLWNNESGKRILTIYAAHPKAQP